MIIPGFSAYDISTDGVVTKVDTGEVIKARVITYRSSPAEYKVVGIRSDDGYHCQPNVLRLLAITYLGEPGRYSIASPIDGNNLNTVVSNVRWSSRSAAMKQAWSDGKFANRNKKKVCSNDDAVRMIKETMLAYDGPVTMVELANALQIPYTLVRYSMETLRMRGTVRKTTGGFEVIK